MANLTARCDRRLVAIAVAASCVWSTAGCARAESAGGSDSAAIGESPASTLRVATTDDSIAALALTDSLVREGWEAAVERRRSPADSWRVQVVVPGDAALGGLAGFALRRAGLTADVLPTTPARRPFSVTVTRVNGGTHGMSAHVRWLASPNKRALLVVEDPHAVENDPLPNGFALASEGAPLIQRDSVWDVAPAPDWRRVAYARAFTTAAAETDSIPPGEWHRLAGQVGLLESLVRRNAFPTSGMVVAYGSARPFVVEVGQRPADSTTAEEGLPIAEGWRVAWTQNGSRLAIGAPPEPISDDGAASRWRLVDPSTGAPRGDAQVSALAELRFTEGPTLDLATPIDMQERRAFRIVSGDVESEGGWIRLFVRDGARLRSPRIIGPGVALTTTANGEFVVAIAPDPNAKSYEPPNHLVVYHIRRR